MIYVCPQCVGVDRSTITAKTKDFGDRIIWNEFSHETDYGELTERYDNLKTIETDRINYFTSSSKIPK